MKTITKKQIRAIEKYWDSKTKKEKDKFKKIMKNPHAGKKEYVEGIIKEYQRQHSIQKEKDIIKELNKKLRKINNELKK